MIQTNYDILKEYEEHQEPIPTYEEWRDLKDDLATCDEDLNNVCEQKEELYEENQRLKELLKELRMSVMFDKDLVEKIDEVLKEC